MRGCRRWQTAASGALLSVLVSGTGSGAQAPAAPATLPAGQTASAQGATGSKEETCRVSGTVVKMADGTPLKNATVQLSAEADREHNQRTVAPTSAGCTMRPLALRWANPFLMSSALASLRKLSRNSA